jgi:SPP1 gp7 family putative phage head morphogenesis protein
MSGLPEDPRGRELVLMIERAKYERWLSNEIADILRRASDDLVSTILSPTFRTLSRDEQARKLQLFRELDRQMNAGYATVKTTALREMEGYAELEAEVARAQIRSMLTGASERLQVGTGAILTSRAVAAVATLPIEGLSISDWFEAQAAGMSRETRRVIQNGLLQGKTLPEIVRGIVPPRSSVEPAVYRRARSDGMSIVRTTVNAVQNYGAMQGYEGAGDDVSDRYALIAVRDARTTAICRALDGKEFRYSDPHRRIPPFHVGCRTSTRPIVNGVPDASTFTFGSYGEWLRGQAKGVQDTILGPTRAEWWRTNKMSLADAVDGDNRVLTLRQLRERLNLTAPRRSPAEFAL